MKTPRKIQNQLAAVQVIIALLLMTASTVRADYQSYVLGNSPLAFYPLSPTVDPTGTNATDLSGHGNTGAYINASPEFNAVSGPSAAIPYALQLDGVSDFVDLGTATNQSILNFSGQITMEAWVQPANSTSFGNIMGKGYDSVTGNEIMMRVDGPYGPVYDVSSGSAGLTGGQQNNTWTHVVLANNGTTTSLYLNGALVKSTGDTSGAKNFSDAWAIGNGSSAGNTRFFNGNICQVAIYNYGLSPDAIFAHYFYGTYGSAPSNSIPLITNQPVSQVSYTNGSAVFSVGILNILPLTNQWYKNGSPISGQTNKILVLSNISASDVASYSVTSGNSNGSTNSASVSLTLAPISAYEKTVVSDGPLAYYPLDKIIDSTPIAQDFSGNGNFGYYVNVDPVGNNVAGPSATIPNGVNFGGAMVDLGRGNQPSLLNFAGPISMEAWVQPADSTTFGDIVAKGYDPSSYQETVVRVNGPYGANYYANSASGGVSGGQQNQVWTHVVLSSDGANCKLYINGALIQSVSDTGGSQLFSDTWAIGNGTGAGNTRFFNGAISQVAIYNHGLTTNQILQHYFLGAFNVPASNSIPVISVQPQPQSAFGGGTATFTFSVVGVLPTTNLWLKNGSPLVGQTNSTLVLNNIQSSDAANYSVVIGNSIGKTNSAAASLTVQASGNSLVWAVPNNNGVWDSGTSPNWMNISNNQQVVFNTGDKVLFDDTPGVPTTVSINDPVNNSVSPSSITVNSDNNAYTISGPNPITGAGSFTKKGTSTLTLLEPSGGYNGPVTIAGGIVYAGNNCFSAVSSITITNNSTMDIGGGNFNTSQSVTLSGAGVNNQGALIDTYGGNTPLTVLNLTLAGDATIGGSSRWDMGTASVIQGAHTLTIDWSADTGNPYGEMTAINVATNVSGIILTNASKIGAKNMDTAFQNPSTLVTLCTNSQLIFWSGGWNGSLDVFSGAQVYMWTAPAAFNGTRVTLEDNAQWLSWGGSGNEPINSAVTLAGIAHMVVGDHNMIYTNLISGPGGFVLDNYSGGMVLSSSNTYAGPTVIGALGNTPQIALAGNGSISHSSLIFFGGTNYGAAYVDVTGRADKTLTLASGQTLGGIGGVNGSVVVSTGATLAPGGTNTLIGITTGSYPTGKLTATTNITLNGTTLIKLNGSGNNDVVACGGKVTYGGILNLVDISGAGFAAGNSFQIFNAATYAGSFTSITPTTPGPGLIWDLSQLNSGKINVITGTQQPVIASTKITSGNLIFSGSGGAVSGTYYVLATTNLATPLTNWIIVSTNQFDASGNFSVTNPVGSGVPKKFYLLKE